VLEATLTPTGRLAADAFDLGQGSDQDGLADSDLFEPTGEHAANVARMAADAHGSLQSDIIY